MDRFPIQETRLRPLNKGFNYSVRQYYHGVWKQQRKGSSLVISATHMLMILYRMRGNNQWLELSPNALLPYVREDGMSPVLLEQVLTTGGLEEWDNSPIYEYVSDFVYTPGSQRYTIERFRRVEGLYNIIFELRKNFDSNGRHYPIIALCLPMGPLVDNGVASATEIGKPYHMGASNSYSNVMNYGSQPQEPQHAVLITGLYTMTDYPNPLDHSVEIKNSFGAAWGTGGYAWVTADIFMELYVPVMHGDE